MWYNSRTVSGWIWIEWAGSVTLAIECLCYLKHTVVSGLAYDPHEGNTSGKYTCSTTDLQRTIAIEIPVKSDAGRPHNSLFGKYSCVDLFSTNECGRCDQRVGDDLGSERIGGQIGTQSHGQTEVFVDSDLILSVERVLSKAEGGESRGEVR